MLSDLLFRLRALVQPRVHERELGEEFEFHLEMETRKLRAEGLSEEAALREARRRFGNITYQQERTRDAWGIRMIRDALSEHVERRRADPDFQAQLKRNLERHADLLGMLADG